MKQKILGALREYKTLLSSVPPLCFALFILSVFAMNLLANKSLDIPLDWLALDCGIIVSWLAFLCMDVLTKHFGAKAATQISITAIVVNLAVCLIMFVASEIPGTWGAFFDFGQAANDSLDQTIRGSWYVVLGSTAAFVISAFVNNFTNLWVGKAFSKNPDGFAAYACRTYVSTAIGQFVDNLVFALIVSHFFFGWTIVQCLTCAATGMIAELVVEAVFSGIGYKICLNWKERGVGKAYFDFKKTAENGDKI